MYSLNIH